MTEQNNNTIELVSIEDLVSYKEDIRSDIDSYIDCLCDYDGGTYISDAISEIADSHVDLYNSDLLEWVGCGCNSAYVEEAWYEFGTPKSFYESIQQGQYLAYQNELYEDIENGVKLYALEYAINNGYIFTYGDYKTMIDELENNARNYNRLIDIENCVTEWACDSESEEE